MYLVWKVMADVNLGTYQPSAWDHIVSFDSLDLYWSSPESGDLWYKSHPDEYS